MNLSRRQLIGSAAALAAAEALLPIAANAVDSWSGTVDVIIAGTGAAGICAAIEALRGGLDVLAIESRPTEGGSTALSGGVLYLGAGTALQKAAGFEDDAEAMAAFISAGQRYPDLKKIALYCEQSPAHFDWLVANGVPFTNTFSPGKERPEEPVSLFHSGGERGYPFSELAKPAPRGHVPATQGRSGALLIGTLNASARKLGMKLVTDSPLEKLIVESDGRVVGVAYRSGGTTTHVRARRGVVLACGGFIHNSAMTELYAPVLRDCVPLAAPGDIGTGIRLAQGIGAATARLDEGFAIIPLYPPEHLLNGIIVNRSGQRFVAEDSYYGVLGHHIAYLQQGKAYLIVNQHHALPAENHKFTERARGTPTEIAHALQLPAGALEATLSYYNAHGAEAHDPLLRKASRYVVPLQSPLVAYDLSLGSTFFPAHTFGGLRTDTDSRVIHVNGEPIPGLYAAGRTARGLPAAPYLASGLSLGDATFFGRRAGRHLAQQRS